MRVARRRDIKRIRRDFDRELAWEVRLLLLELEALRTPCLFYLTEVVLIELSVLFVVVVIAVKR